MSCKWGRLLSKRSPLSAWQRYRLRWRRKKRIWQGFRSRRELTETCNRTNSIGAHDILCFVCVRNERLRLPYFLQYYRHLGVSHFLFVDNGSDDGTAAYLSAFADVSLWHTKASYKAARFGMDWLTGLQWRYGAGHWCVTVDADELLVYPDCETETLPALTAYLDRRGLPMMGAVMLDLYPKGPIEHQTYKAGQNPLEVLPYFDAFGYWVQLQPKMQNLWLQGGPRARCFFADDPRRAPTLNKIPLVKWRRSFVYVNSTHNALPPFLNQTYDQHGVEKPTGALLHTKFLPGAATRAKTEQRRKEHFSNSALYDAYYDAVSLNPDLWTPDAVRYEGSLQLEDIGIMQRGGGYSR